MLDWLAPKEWAVVQFGDCRLGDLRRTKRLVAVGSRMVSRSCLSIPKQMLDWASVKGAYRLFANPAVTHQGISAPHWSSTLEQARHPGQGLVLFVQDQTELDFGAQPDSKELGFVGSTYARGFEVQSVLCVRPAANEQTRPEVIGLALQTPWVRDHAPRKKIEPEYARTKRRTEYDVWEESVAAIGAAPNADAGTTWVTVGDRGSDIFNHLEAATRLGWRFLVRSKHNRKLCGEDAQGRLHQRIREMPAAGRIHLRLRARPGQPARTAELQVSFCQATLPATFKARAGSQLEASCVRVWEEPRAGVASPIEWILLTSLPVQGLEDALRIVELYRHRWLIEEYHKCLKTGAKIEERHLSHRDRLLALLGVLSIVAVMLLQLKAPDHDLKPPEEMIRIVKLATNAKEDLEEPRALLRRIAMMGGFLGRKGDGEPGWQTIWHGWMRLQDILIGIDIATRDKCG